MNGIIVLLLITSYEVIVEHKKAYVCICVVEILNKEKVQKNNEKKGKELRGLFC